MTSKFFFKPYALISKYVPHNLSAKERVTVDQLLEFNQSKLYPISNLVLRLCGNGYLFQPLRGFYFTYLYTATVLVSFNIKVYG